MKRQKYYELADLDLEFDSETDPVLQSMANLETFTLAMTQASRSSVDVIGITRLDTYPPQKKQQIRIVVDSQSDRIRRQ